MAKPVITVASILRATCDQDDRITEEWEVQGNNLNVKNVKTARFADGRQGLPKEGDPDSYGDDLNDKSYCSKVNVTHAGKRDASGDTNGQMKVSVSYLPVDEFSAKKKKKKKNGLITDPKFPWDAPAKIKKTGDAIEVDMWGSDEKGSPLLYSNSEMVNLKKSVPLSVMSITFAKKINDTTADWWNLTDDFLESVNNNAVSLKIANKNYSYAARTLIVAGADVSVEFFEYTDPVTLLQKTTLYFAVDLSIVHKKNTWATRIPDEGHLIFEEDGDGTKKVVRPKNLTDKHRVEQVLLNGKGGRILGDNFVGSLRQVSSTPWGGESETGNGVEIDEVATLKLAGGNAANARIVMLAFLTHEEKDFGPLGLDTLLAKWGG